MIQILGLRHFVPSGQTNEVSFDKFFEEKWRAESVLDLFTNIEKYVEQIPPQERWNLFYTINSCTEQKRDFKSHDVLAIDIDGGMEALPGKAPRDKGKVDASKWTEYQKVIAEIFETIPENLAVVHSGNGLHVLVQRNTPIKDRQYFNKNRHHFKAVCTKINLALQNQGLGGEADPSAFEHRRILRLPNTTNRKVGKPDTKASILHLGLVPVDFDLAQMSGLPDVSETDHIPKEIMAKYPNVDTEAVKKGCAFLKWCIDEPGAVTEPLWYAALSIAGRLDNGLEFAHELSRGHPHYNPTEVESKYAQAIEASGPRTCKNIAHHGFNGCIKCPHKDTVISPISIVSEGHIKTLRTGFHSLVPGKTPKPNIDDLRQHYENKTNYKSRGSTKQVYVYRKGYYEEEGHNEIEGFAETHLFPKPKTPTTREFLNKVIRTNIRKDDFWVDSVKKKINFQNGYLNMDSGEFFGHTPDIGFQYILPYEYNPSADAPVFKAMLERVTLGDSNLQQVLLEFMGYALSDDTCWLQKALVLTGDGSNAKSTFINVLRKLAGDGNYSSASMLDLRNSEYTRQQLDGKLFNVAEETPTSAMAETGLFKDLISGGELYVRQIFRGGYNMKNKAKFIFSCNTLPESSDTTSGFYRRLIIVPFNAVFSSRDADFDPHIESKLELELAGIFNLALHGYRKLLARGRIQESDIVDKAIASYIHDTDTVLTWFSDNTKVGADISVENPDFAVLSDLYLSYKLGTEAQGLKPVNRTKFTRDLRKKIPDFDSRYCTKKIAGVLKRGLRGLKYGDGVGLEDEEVTQEYDF